MAVKWVDRVPTYPNRVKITPENGSPYYATVERADSPTVTGTPVNAQNLNAMQEAAGLTAQKTVYVSTGGSDSVGDGTEANPYATIAKALAVIPKNLNGFTATIMIAAGTYYESPVVRDFGNGVLKLSGNDGDVVTLSGLHIHNTALVEINNIQIHISNAYLSVETANVRVLSAFSASGGRYGVHVAYSSSVVFSGSLTVNNTTSFAVVATMASTIYVFKLIGSGNFTAFGALHGSICTFNSNESTAEVLYSTTNGSRI